MYSCEGKSEFTASLLPSSVSHDHSEIILICWFVAQETFLINNVLRKQSYVFFSTKLKEQ